MKSETKIRLKAIIATEIAIIFGIIYNSMYHEMGIAIMYSVLFGAIPLIIAILPTKILHKI